MASEKFIFPLEKEIKLGYVPRIDSATGNILQVPKTRVFHYIPLKLVIKVVAESPGFFECLNEHIESTDGIMRDFHDVQYCKTHNLLSSKNCLLLVLFNDDVEVTNPLSPKAGTHKLGVFTIPFRMCILVICQH